MFPQYRWIYPQIPVTYISTSVIESQYIEIFRQRAGKLPFFSQFNKDIQKRATFRFMFEFYHIFRSNIIFYYFARDCENRFKLKRTFSSKPSKHIWTNLPCIGIGVNCNLHKICEIYEICKVAR